MAEQDWRPKLVALDIDGTLLRWVVGSGPVHGEVPPAVRAAVRRAYDAGAHIVLASGRSLHAMTPIADQLGLPDDGVYARDPHAVISRQLGPNTPASRTGIAPLRISSAISSGLPNRPVGLRASRIRFASSSAIYGDHGETAVHEDIGPLEPISHYGAMKLASEAAIRAACESYIERADIFRFPQCRRRAGHAAGHPRTAGRDAQSTGRQ